MDMGRKIKGREGVKSEKIDIRIDEHLRKRIEFFALNGPCAGEELQVVVRMLIRTGLAVEEKFKVVRDEIEQTIEKRGVAMREERERSSAKAGGT